ncbi:MAG: ATP-binding protein [Pseudomonadota bacterium]
MTMDFETLWHALPNPALLVGADGRVNQANDAAEAFLAMSRRALSRRDVLELAGEDSRLADLIRRVRDGQAALSEYNVEFTWPEAPMRHVDMFADPLDGGAVLLVLYPRANAERLGRQLSSRGAARSIVGMASMLAHEIKNPLAGISGAAQLLEMGASTEDQELTAVIQQEVQRIGELLQRVDAFGDMGLAKRNPVNIHDMLDRASKAAKVGYAAHVRFVEEYDPSLPPTFGDPDQLTQVVVNLLKNAAEAMPPVGGVLMIRTAYRAGVKVRTHRGQTESLPLQIEISDNGEGVPEELKPHLFEPFVTSKASGSGLGLALVSKVITDHGGIISCDSTPGFTTFRILLPVASRAELAAEDGLALEPDTEDAA